MLKIENFYKKINCKKSPVVMCLGHFDSVHIGHRSLIYKAVDLAKANDCISGVLSFSDGLEADSQVYTFAERKSIFQTLGVQFCASSQFNEKFKSIAWDEFLEMLLKQINVKYFVCGADFKFGNNAEGTVRLLKDYCAKRGIQVIVCSTVEYKWKKASTTLAKEFIAKGELEQLNELLGASFFVSGKVEKDRKVGTKIGMPTANLTYPDCKIKVKEGVYKVNVIIDGMIYDGIASYGSRPTFDEPVKKLEVHILDYDQQIYGKKIDVHFEQYIRGIIKFDNAEDLVKQIQEDIESIR